MKTILVLFVLTLAAPLHGEGIASMTDVTAGNANKLKHHGLAVIRKSQLGKSYIALIIRPQKETPLGSCSVTIYHKSGKQILFQVDPIIGSAPKLQGLPDGSRISFHVTDDLLNDIEIRYHLIANARQSHVFTIPRGHLAEVAKL